MASCFLYRRRAFIALLSGAAAAWPLTARAQQPVTPVIGYLSGGSPNAVGYLLAAFRRGLAELGFVEGQNVNFDYRWANNRPDQIPGMATDLVVRRVTVIAAVNGIAAPIAAMTATKAIPIVFALGVDPIKQGLVTSLNRPGGNVTGISFLNNTLTPKMVELLNEIVPKSGIIGMLVNPKSPNVDFVTRDAHIATDALGRKLVVIEASTRNDFAPAFAKLQQQTITALLIASDSFLDNNAKQMAELAQRYALVAVSPRREFAEAGGLMSYGTNVPDAFRLTGTYAGRILKGQKPGDLPVQQSTNVELILNLKTAKVLGITFPITLLGRADEVIE